MANYSGLILLTGETKVGIEAEILDTLAPFSITILDKQSMDIRGRFFLAIHISLDKAHRSAIEGDLTATAERLGIDLAIDYQDK